MEGSGEGNATGEGDPRRRSDLAACQVRLAPCDDVPLWQFQIGELGKVRYARLRELGERQADGNAIKRMPSQRITRRIIPQPRNATPWVPETPALASRWGQPRRTVDVSVAGGGRRALLKIKEVSELRDQGAVQSCTGDGISALVVDEEEIGQRPVNPVETKVAAPFFEDGVVLNEAIEKHAVAEGVVELAGHQVGDEASLCLGAQLR